MWSDDYEISGYDGGEHPEKELAAFALNALEGAEFEAVAEHVTHCLHCQEVLVGFQDTAARLTGGAPEKPLPPSLKARTLSRATQPGAHRAGVVPAYASIPPATAGRWQQRLRGWIAPTAIGTLSLMLAATVWIIWEQQQEIAHLSALQSVSIEAEQGDAVSATVRVGSAVGGAGGAEDGGLIAVLASPDRVAGPAGSSVAGWSVKGGSEEAALIREEMADVMEMVMMAASPGTETLQMSSPMGVEPMAKGVLMVDPSGLQSGLTVSGVPADSYQLWLVRAGNRMLVGRIVVKEGSEGKGVQTFRTEESVYDFQEAILIPDERNGPTAPNGEKFLVAIIEGPPLPPGGTY